MKKRHTSAALVAYATPPFKETDEIGAAPLRIVPSAKPALTSANQKINMSNRTVELTVFDKATKRRVVRHSRNPARAAQFEEAQREWEADMARRKIERCSPHDPVNVVTDDILGTARGNDRACGVK